MATQIRMSIPQMAPWFGEEEKQALMAYMDEGGFLTEFRHTAEFEELIAEYTGAKHCIVVNNGTISLTLAAIAVGVKPGDEVIVPNYTMIATPNSIQMLGARPVFVDVESDTLCLDLEQTRAAITPRTRAIMFVAANGRYPTAGIAAFEKLAQESGIALIEDAAQGLGSRYPDGRHVGLAGCIGSLSFSAPKIISTGQGGALLTNDDELAARIRKLKDFGRATGGTDIHDAIGYNFKFTDLQACVGIEQMKKLPWRVARKREIYRRYEEGLGGLRSVHLFAHDLRYTVPWFIDVMADDRAGLIAALREAGIGARVMYPPINQQKAWGVAGSFPVSEDVGERGLWLPSSTQLTDDEVDYVCAVVQSHDG